MNTNNKTTLGLVTSSRSSIIDVTLVEETGVDETGVDDAVADEGVEFEADATITSAAIGSESLLD